MGSYNLAVIGAGPGGYVSAIRAAQYGMKVAVIEKSQPGGTCLNRGCVPTKSIMHSAHLYSEILKSKEFGITADNIHFDIDKIYSKKDETLTKLRGGIEQLFKANKIDYIQGNAVITGQDTIEITGDENRTVKAENILIAVGSKPSVLPERLQNKKNVFTSDEVLSGEQKLHEKIVIIGGGVIGVELATVYNAFGCDVSIVEALPKILPLMDREISQNLSMILKKRGIKIFTSALVEDIEEKGEGLVCSFSLKGNTEAVACDAVLVSIGRRPNTKGLLGKGIQLEMDRGFIEVNENFQTGIPNIYAIGDCIKGIQLAHMASAQGLNAVSHMAGKKPSVDLSAVPSCIYSEPEIASVGITAEDAKEQGIAVKTGKYIMNGNAKSMLSNQERGFIKLIFEEESNVIVGAQLMCARATDLISELSSAIVNKLTAEALSSVIRPHPTFSEGITEAVEDIDQMAVHIVPKVKL